ncbi:HIT family protein [Salinigranum salinum]|uniref:HIT family protein n=1 Tax=Salinigranum salinum TaxID=1364937 RepID=UPI001260F3BC|nr:HIT domain-containing protein [Salinigranum salinum]
MDQLFAPWRIQWVERDGDDGSGCPFCTLPERDDDADARIVARSAHAFVLFNNYPYNPGHVMVIPYRHTGEYGALSDAELLDHARLKARTFDALEAALGPDAFNAGLNLGGPAGGSIEDHLHTHVVPRWNGDTNFMPVVSETKVIVEAVAETYERVHETFAAQPGATVTDTGAVRFAFDADTGNDG